MTDDKAKNMFLDFCKERLNLIKLFRWNAAMKHGVPMNELDKITINHIIEDKTKSPPEDQSAHPIKMGTDSTNVSSVNVPKMENSALQWLEDQGEHLP